MNYSMNYSKSLNVGKSMDEKKIELTKEGIEKRKKRLYDLINVVRPQILRELVEARKQGDLSENADYDVAKNKQSEVEAEILELEMLLTRASLMKKAKSDEISMGTTITYVDIEKDMEKTITIVNTIESDPTENPPLISIESPLASSMIGKKENDEVDVLTPKRNYKVKILKIEN